MMRDLKILSLLAVAVVAVYWPVSHDPFVVYDDPRYVYGNPMVRDGFTREGVIHAFAGTTQGNWQPLAMLSHMLDCQLFGLRAGWHHVVNAVLHLADTMLLYLALKRMTGEAWKSAMVAALFAIHPLHVESVAWISERKDVLSGLFFMLALLAYSYYARRPRAGSYSLVVLAMALGLMAKPMLVTLPFVLLLLDVWPLGRCEWFRRQQADGPTADSSGPASNTRLILEKIPLLVLAAGASVATYLVQRQSGAMSMLGPTIPSYIRLINAMASYTSYIEKTLYPDPLAVFYPYVAHPFLNTIFAVSVPIGLTVLVLRGWRQRPYLGVGWFWFLGMLVPVIGLVQVGAQSMADRYTYLPLIGLFLIVVWGVAEITISWPVPNRTVAACGVLLGFALLAGRQLTFWANSETLFRHAAESVRNNFFARDSLGLVLWQENRLDDAAAQFQEALKISPNQEPTHRKLGVLLGVLQRPDEAIFHLREAIRLQPEQPQAYQHLAWILATCPDPRFRDGAEAVQLAKRACESTRVPDPEYLDTLAAAQAEAGRYSEAIVTIRNAIDLARRVDPTGDLKPMEARLSLYKDRQPYHAPLANPKML